MNVLVTGAFGNLGVRTIRELLAQGHTVRAFELRTPGNRKAANEFRNRVDICWGDIRDATDVRAAVEGRDAVIHLAYIIPPWSERRPSWARDINVGGTVNLIAAMQAQPAPPRLVFASTVMVFGLTQDRPPPRRVEEPVQAINHYNQQKIECEQLIRASGLEWSILRLGAAMPVTMDEVDPVMFDIPLDNRIEFVHPADVGLALANTLGCPEAFGKILLIGGGPACQFRQRELIQGALECTGIGMLPDSAFGTAQFGTDWMDTTESQRLLKFQRHTYPDLLREMRRGMGVLRLLVRAFRPLVRRMLLRASRYYHPDAEGGWFLPRGSVAREGSVAIVTGASSGIGAATARKLAAHRLRVVLVARRKDRLKQLAQEIRETGGEVLVVAADLSLEADRVKVYEAVHAKYGSPDILINNAGFSWYGFGYRMPWELASQMIKVNAEAIAHLTLMYLPEMRRRNRGHVVNIGSISGALPEQGTGVYSATKAFTDAFSTCLYRELRGTGVHITVVRAGPVATELFDLARALPSGMPIPAERFAVPAERVADRIWAVLRRPRRVAFVPRFFWFTPWVEPGFGWIIDRLGPLLLKRHTKSAGSAGQ